LPSNIPYRWLVIRVPGSGPPAAITPAIIYESEAEALAQIERIEANHRKTHHTYLDTFRFTGDIHTTLTVAGINY